MLGPAGAPTDEVLFVSDGAREIEELNADGSLRADYVYGGLYVDQVVQARIDKDGSAGPAGLEEYYLHASSIWSVQAVTNAAGQVVERYEYDSIYGKHTVTDAAGAPVSAANEIGNPWRFQGRRLDPETGLLFFRARYFDPELGRFVSRDPLGIWGDPGQRGNGYSFCGDDPVNRVDPSGLNDAHDAAVVLELTAASLDEAARVIPGLKAVVDNLRAVADALSPVSEHDPPTPAPDFVLGTTDYYRWRWADFRLRHRDCECEAPDYYLGYGDKYVRRFAEFGEGESEDVRCWTERTALELQKAMEDKLRAEPELERDSAKFRNMAFETHAKSYHYAGISGLTVGDWVKIAQQPDLGEWLSAETWDQAFQTGDRILQDVMAPMAKPHVSALNCLWLTTQEGAAKVRCASDRRTAQSGPSFDRAWSLPVRSARRLFCCAHVRGWSAPAPWESLSDRVRCVVRPPRLCSALVLEFVSCPVRTSAAGQCYKTAPVDDRDVPGSRRSVGKCGDMGGCGKRRFRVLLRGGPGS